MINVSNRPSIKIQTFDEKGPVIQIVAFALFEDLSESIFLMEYSNGVRPYVLEWYYDVFLSTFESHKDVASKLKIFGKTEQLVYENRIAVTTSELIAKTKEVKARSCNSNQLLQTFVYPLMNQGYIDSVESELDHRAHIYFPVTTGKYIKLLQNDKYNILLQPNKTHVRDSTVFPYKTYLISRIQGVLKYYYDEGIRAILCDHEGKEISVENLVERYYNKPEDYFDLDNEDIEKNGDANAVGIINNNNNNDSQNDNSQNETSNNNISETPENTTIYNESIGNKKDMDNNDSEKSKKSLHQSEHNNIIYSDSTIEIDPSLAGTTRFLHNLREEYDEYQCSACQYKEAILKNSAKPLSCPKCKSKS